ncbi:MAG: hypothetical protein DRP27_03530 [Thermotogae bacterium]|nr:MAG: hypothetical protein DRP27_03530 [Thermotogota bacterium]
MIELADLFDFSDNSNLFFDRQTGKLFFRTRMKEISKHKNNYLEDFIRFFNRLSTSLPGIQEFSRSASLTRFSVSLIASGEDHSIKSTISSNNSLERTLDGANTPRRFLSSMIVNGNGFGLAIQSNDNKKDNKLSNANLWQIKTSLKGEKTIQVFGFSGFDFGNQDAFSIFPVKNYSPISDSKPVNFNSFSSSDEFSELERGGLSQIKFQFFNNPLLFSFGEFFQFLSRFLGEVMTNHNPNSFLTFLPLTLPDLRDSSISFQNSGFEYSILSNKSSVASKNRLITSAGTPFVEPDLFERVNLPIHSYDNKKDNKLSNAKWIKVIYLKPGDEIAVLNNSGEVVFEKIKSIEFIGYEHVYDIAVEGTHNFVANGILAHNTYISGNVGIGTTSPEELLHLYGADKNFKLTDTAIATRHVTLGIGNNPLGAGYPGVIFNTVVESGNQMGYVFQVEGSTKLVIDKDGNVGIGTTEPGAKLDIRYSGDGNFIRIANTYNDIGVRLGFDGNRPFLQTWQPSTGNDNSWSIALQPNGGNVGIGTTGPSSKLDITASDYNLLRLERASIATYGIYITDIGAGAAQLDFAALTNNTGFIFRSKDSGGAEINALFIKPDGNVGIGTTAPGAKLDIADAGSAAGSKFVLIGDDSFLTDIDVANTLGVYGNQNSTVASIKLGSGGGTISGYNGNIGIGTTAPNEKLEVVGDIRMEGGSGFGDLLFTDGTAYGTNRYSGQISLLASLKGRLLNYNPSFCMGTYEYSVYDNSHSGKVTITTVDDTTSPSVCGKILKVSYDGTGTPGSQPTPGYGGFYIAVTKCNGAATEDCYIEGNRYVYRIWAKIPSGRSINFASNPYGTGSSFRWISSTAGTGTWEQYIGVQKIGEGGTFSSTGFFYISSGDNVAFDWYVANVEVIGIDEPASVDLTKSLNVGFKTGVNLGSGNLLTASGTYLAVDSGNVGIGTTNPSYKLDVSGDIRATNVVYANTGVQAGWFKASSDGVKIYPSGYTANPGLLVYTGNGSSWVERMRITGNASTANVSFTNSNVGIGTTAPSAKLEIAKVAGAASKDALRIGIDGEYDARIKFFDDDDEAGQYAQIIYGAGSNKFYLYNKGAGITIDSAGNVGIGTTSPGTLLEIEGSSGGGSLTKIKTTDIWDSSHAEDLLIIDGGSATDANTGGYFGIRMQSGVNANKAVGLYAVSESSWSNYVGLAIYTWNDANYREVVRIRGSGNVGIGTTNPGYKLDVAGTGRFTSNLTVGGNLTVSGGKINNRSISTFSTVVWKNSPAAYSLTRDNAWHDLDVTSVTSANTRAVILSIYMYRGGGGGEMYCFTRRNGSTASYEGLVRSNPIAEQTGTAHIGGVVVQGTDSGQVFEYKCYTDVSSATLQVLGYIEYATGADLAEVYYVDEGEEVEAGDVVVTGSSGERVRKSSKPYQKEVIGVVSTKPGLVIGEEPTGIDIDTDRIAVVALAGRVPVKVSTENGPIEVGDWLTPSSKPGVAMKATGPGPVIGKALEAYDNPNPDETGKILMFVSLGWYGGNDPIPEVTININGELYTGTGEELDESSNIFVQLVKQALGVLGATIENGIVQLKELVAEKIFAKEIKVEKVRFEKIEMVDQETGQVWCLWIENGEWRKVNTECDNLPFEVTPVEESVLSEPESQSENSSEEISESEDLLSDQENTTEVISSGGGGGSADENQIDQTQDINGQSSDTSTTESETIDTQTNDTQQTTEAQSTENQLIEDQSTVENGGESNSLQETTQETIQDTTSSEEINENSQDSTLELSSDTQSNKEGLASENENTIFTEEQSADQLETQSDTSSEGGDTVLETQSTESQSTEAQSATFQSTNTTETTETTETTTQTTDIQSENSQIESSGQSVDTQSSDTQASNDRSSDSQPTNNQATETSSAKTSSPDNSSAESSSTETPPTSGDSTSSPTTQ